MEENKHRERRRMLEEFDEERFAKESEELLELRLLTKENARFTRTSGGFAALDFNGTHYDRIYVYCTFPLTDMEQYISIREANDKAKEIGIIEKLIDLDKEQADILKEQLAMRYYMPKIQKLLDIKDEYGYAYFEVLTDFGSCRFTIHMNSGSVVPITETRIIITDLDGNRYEIPDIRKLTSSELKKLDLFL